MGIHKPDPLERPSPSYIDGTRPSAATPFPSFPFLRLAAPTLLQHTVPRRLDPSAMAQPPGMAPALLHEYPLQDPAVNWSPYPPPSIQNSYNDSGSSRNSMAQGSQATFEEQVPLKASNEGSAVNPEFVAVGSVPKRKSRWLIYLGAAVAIILIALAVVIPVYFTVIKPKSTNANSAGSSGASSAAPEPTESTGADFGEGKPGVLLRGGNGSTITMANGTTFTYHNEFGGTWVHDPADPFNLDAQANSWTPPLKTRWRWGKDRVMGVNLGGHLLLEPFITPGIFQRHPTAVDEFTLSTLLRAAGPDGLKELEDHYETFITEQDIAEIAGAGLNWLRVPIGFWAIEKYDNEPFLERTSWTYFLRVVEWCRKYGLRIYLDLHGAPGSQNGLNHSARLGFQSLLHGNMGLANAQRALYYLRVLVQFISQPEYRDVIPIIGLINEPMSRPIGMDVLSSFYLEAYRVIREVTGFGEGNGPYIAVGDGFRSALEWEGLMPNADRFIMDIHPYVAFDEGFSQDLLTVPAADGQLGGKWPTIACERWGTYFNDTRRALGVTVGGEFSGAINDCGLFMRAVGIDSGHPQCALYNAWETWSPDLKDGLKNFILASFDAIGDFFWWTWKIGPSAAGRVETPMWSYKLGLEQGWIPTDPRESFGKCAALGVPQAPFDGNFQPWQTGAVARPSIPASYSAANPWPPTTISGAELAVSLMPTYTSSGTPITLPLPTFTGAPESVLGGVDGWSNDADSSPAITPIASCSYPDQYTASFAVLPTTVCS